MKRTSETHTLVPSSNGGRYAFDDPYEGHDLASGERIALLLNGVWVDGLIEHAGHLYAVQQHEASTRMVSGYYFIGSQGGICGLCAGMKVRER